MCVCAHYFRLLVGAEEEKDVNVSASMWTCVYETAIHSIVWVDKFMFPDPQFHTLTAVQRTGPATPGGPLIHTPYTCGSGRPQRTETITGMGALSILHTHVQTHRTDDRKIEQPV